MKKAAIWMIIATLAFAIIACGEDDDSNDEQGLSSPYSFVTAEYNVTVSKESGDCFLLKSLEDYSAYWNVFAAGDSVVVVTAPLVEPDDLKNDVADQIPGPYQEDALAEIDAMMADPVIPMFMGQIKDDLSYTASLTTEQSQDNPLAAANGDDQYCLKQVTTMLEINFTDGKTFSGKKKIFENYTGGGSCSDSCQTIYSVTGSQWQGPRPF